MHNTSVHVLHSFRLKRIVHTRRKISPGVERNFLFPGSWKEFERKQTPKEFEDEIFQMHWENTGEFHICILATPWAEARDPRVVPRDKRENVSTRAIAREKIMIDATIGKILRFLLVKF